MSGTLFAVQSAVVATLAGDTDVLALIGNPARLYDHVPPGIAFPYMSLGAVQVQPYDDKLSSGFEQIVTLDIWSRYRGAKEAKDIAQAVYAALHQAALAPDSGVAILCEFHSAELVPLEDGLTYHASLRFTVITQQD